MEARLEPALVGAAPGCACRGRGQKGPCPGIAQSERRTCTRPSAGSTRHAIGGPPDFRKRQGHPCTSSVSLNSSPVYFIRMSRKQKLTLSIDPSTIEAARKSDINLSQLTESVLRLIGETEGNATTPLDYDEYRFLLGAITPLVKKHGVSVKVGTGEAFAISRDFDGDPNDHEQLDVWLVPSGRLARSEYGHLDGVELWPEALEEGRILLEENEYGIVRFLPALTIVGNLLEEVSRVREKHRRERESLGLAIQFVELLRDRDSGRAHNHADGKKSPRPAAGAAPSWRHSTPKRAKRGG